jgi:hypothetical protein
MTRYLVLSDMHFGEALSSVNKPKVLQGLVRHIADLGPVTVVFSGDTLDLNLATFTRSIEGDAGSVTGFRAFLSMLQAAGVHQARWVYLPGNHDYRIWDLLSTKRACMDVLAHGQLLTSIKHPLYADRWVGRESFLAGVFPEAWRESLLLEYPEHVVATGTGELVITHGHYFDPKQTLKNTLHELIEWEQLDPEQAVRKLFIETAVYQMMAGCVSFTEWTRRWANRLVGPASWVEEAKHLARRAAAWFGHERTDLVVSPLRGKNIDDGQLSAMEFYLKYFAHHAVPPKYVVYGHTHAQDHASTAALPADLRVYPSSAIEVYNAGGFYPADGTTATFLAIDVPDAGPPTFTPLWADESGAIQERRLSR